MKIEEYPSVQLKRRAQARIAEETSRLTVVPEIDDDRRYTTGNGTGTCCRAQEGGDVLGPFRAQAFAARSAERAMSVADRPLTKIYSLLTTRYFFLTAP
jgi:hypothetical protein